MIKSFYNISIGLLFLISFVLFAYGIYGFGILVHFDEYVGRGLYPALAFAYGIDLYEPQNGPHMTLYGFGTALFYSLAAIANKPHVCIWICYTINLFGLLIPITYFINQIFLPNYRCIKLRKLLNLVSFNIVICILLYEKTTEGILRIHADLPAFSFILIGVMFFINYLHNKNTVYLIVSSLFIFLSVCAKVTTLPAIFFPIIYFLLNGNINHALKCAAYLIGVAISVSILACSYFGFSDCVTILFDHVKENRWDDRDILFGGTGELVQMGYIEAMPLLLRFFTMYISHYWFIILPIIFIFFTNLSKDRHDTRHSIITILCVLYFLLLPSCLAALAHFGSVHNALLFANATGIIVILITVIFYTINNINLRIFFLLLSVVAIICTLPIVRISKSTPISAHNSPHQQAYDYLEKGNNDIFFGWYPIAHLLHSGIAYTSIEVPIHLTETMPKNVIFSQSHFPKGTNILATGPSGIGSYMLERYLGPLNEIKTTPELSNWRLFTSSESSHLNK